MDWLEFDFGGGFPHELEEMIPVEKSMKTMKYQNTDHTFSVCAYKESEYLEELLISLMTQTVRTNIIIVTSTPNQHINSLAKKYGLPVYVNTGEKGIAGDWNFALRSARTPLVTIAHQDDIYEPEYVSEILAAVNRAKDPIIAFSHYAELREGEKVYKNRLLQIKKIMMVPIRLSNNSIFLRRRSLSLGNPICCPAVTYVKGRVADFDPVFVNNLDWNQWERLSKQKGSFVYVPKALMCHRIHKDSTTSEMIENKIRGQEDVVIFRRFWPKVIAERIARIYGTSEKSNSLDI